ncbi:MAG: diguanylate cyclase, partial [Planctomycetes bacterium]|nr:diguanylate cyclase [Planctomycetota bacterium]
MDGMSGQSLCRALLRCEVGRQLFRIVLTSEADERADVEALQAEAHDVVRKPIHPRDLLARVAVGLSLAESQGELAQVDSMTVRAKSLSETLLHDGHSPEPETLPGLYSRAFATGRLAVAFEDEARPLSIALLAIDALHLPESPLLSKDLTRRLGELLRSSLRKDDVLANTSEGRFLLLCPGADLREASELAERMRAGVDEACIGIGGYVGPITISAGVAERTPSMRSPAVLMVVASTALELGATEAPNQVHPAA